MKLPNLDNAYVPPEKIRDYLLNESHEQGGSKASFFLHFGFSVAEWESLVKASLLHAHNNEVVKVEATHFGTRYVIEGTLSSPDGRNPRVRVVWFISRGKNAPRLVTAYPLEEHDD
jgi:hypothetical protein